MLRTKIKALQAQLRRNALGRERNEKSGPLKILDSVICLLRHQTYTLLYKKKKKLVLVTLRLCQLKLEYTTLLIGLQNLQSFIVTIKNRISMNYEISMKCLDHGSNSSIYHCCFRVFLILWTNLV